MRSIVIGANNSSMLTSNSSSQFSLALISSLPSGPTKSSTRSGWRRSVREPVSHLPFPFRSSITLMRTVPGPMYRKVCLPVVRCARSCVTLPVLSSSCTMYSLSGVLPWILSRTVPNFSGSATLNSVRIVSFFSPLTFTKVSAGINSEYLAPGFHAALIVHSRIFSVSCVKWSGIRLVLRGLAGVFFPSCPSGWEGLFKEGGSGFAPLTGSSSRICSSTIALLSTIANGIEKANLMCFSGLTVPDGVTLTENGFGNFSSGSPSLGFFLSLTGGAFQPNFSCTVSSLSLFSVSCPW